MKQHIVELRFLSSRKFSLIFGAILVLLSATCMGWSWYLAYRDMTELHVMVPATCGLIFAAFATVREVRQGLISQKGAAAGSCGGEFAPGELWSHRQEHTADLVQMLIPAQVLLVPDAREIAAAALGTASPINTRCTWGIPKGSNPLILKEIIVPYLEASAGVVELGEA